MDKSRCSYTDENGQIKNPTETACAQGISAIKAIAIAQSEGQKIYTITQDNAATALPKLPVGGSVGSEIQSAVQAGKEVTVHERSINAHGWSGYGYIVTDPETGAGGYLIEGRGNGGILIVTGLAILVLAIYGAGTLALLGPMSIPIFIAELQLGISLLTAGLSLLFDFPAGCIFSMSSAFDSLRTLLITVGYFSGGIPFILGSMWFSTLMGHIGLSICKD